MFCLFAFSEISLDSLFLNIRLCKIEKNFDYYFPSKCILANNKLKKRSFKKFFFRRLHSTYQLFLSQKLKHFLSSGLFWCWDHFFFVRKIQFRYGTSCFALFIEILKIFFLPKVLLRLICFYTGVNLIVLSTENCKKHFGTFFGSFASLKKYLEVWR